MQSKRRILIAFAATVMAISTAVAHQEPTPQPTPQPTQGHDMSKMQGHDMSKMQDHDMSKMQGDDMSKMQGDDMKGHSPGSMELHKIMMSGSKMPMPMSGDVDRDFASMMTMHHEQAIKMSDVLLERGTSPKLKALAAEMKAAQQEEIGKLAPFAK